MNSPCTSFLYTGFLTAGVAVLLIGSVIWLAPGASSAPPPATITVTVNPDGTFTPRNVNIRTGDTIRWEKLTRSDAIVQIKDPARFPGSDVCGIADNNLDHVFAGADPNEFTGPKRFGVSGVFALGPWGPGFKKVSTATPCVCDSAPGGCNPAPTIVRGNKLCPDEGLPYEILDETWTNPDITGIIIRLSWKDIQTSQLQYNWQDLDRQMNRAVEHGKLFSLDIKAGKLGTPLWIFTDYSPPGPVTKLEFTESETQPACTRVFPLGSPVDPNYQHLYIAMINELASHVASDSRWFQALAHVKVSGANLYSSEARLPNGCAVAAGCVCNSRVWAQSGYTQEGLYRYYRVVGNAIYNAFYQRKSLGYQLIQAGFPKVVNSLNYEGDGDTTDDLNGTIQTETILKQMKNGRFVDGYGTGISLFAGQLFVPQHSGLGRLPEDDGVRPCKQAQTVFANPPPARAGFPIVFPPNVDHGDAKDGCPNHWAVDEGTLNNQIIGFQTNNDDVEPPTENGHIKGIASQADVESALWNMTINSNGVFVEFYEQRLWEISQTRGTGEFAVRLTLNGRVGKTTAPFSKNLHTWMKELNDRRRQLAGMISNRFSADPFPNVYEYTFSQPITFAQTYHYINPSKCSITPGVNRLGRITVSP